MEIWMTICRKKGTCKYCPKPITKGQYMIVGKCWRKNDGTARIWTIYFRWHLKCWIRQAIEALKRRPVVETRGGRKLEIADDVREARLKVLARRGAVVQRIRREVEKPTPEQDIDRIIHLGEALDKLREEIEPLGGAPKSWS